MAQNYDNRKSKITCNTCFLRKNILLGIFIMKNHNIITENHHRNEAICMIKGQMATNGIKNHEIIAAIAETDRSHLVPEYAKDVAYIDEEIRLCANRYLLEPLLFAQMLEHAHINKSHKVLDIGSGYGYSSSVISKLAGEVFGVEESAELVATARKKLNVTDCENIEIVTSPLENGCSSHAPYDRIIINGALAKIPVSIEQQLAEDGLIVGLIAQNKIFATNKVLCNIVVGIKKDGKINYNEKQSSFSYFLKKPKKDNEFAF